MSLKPVKEIRQNSVWLSACVYIQLCDDFTMTPVQSKVTDFFIHSVLSCLTASAKPDVEGLL